jgi:ribosome-associated toxin RatA of RatAB toxin-antitoxin module
MTHPTPSRPALVPGLVLVAFVALFGASACGGAEPAPPTAPVAPSAAAPVEVAPPPAPAAPALPAAPTSEAVPIAGSELVHGRSTVRVSAPVARVREVVTDFAHYAEFMPHYQSSKLLPRTPAGKRNVYMEIEALNGALKMWAELEVSKPVVDADGTETLGTRFVKGNVKAFVALWRIHKVDEASTDLSLEVFLDPGLPLPPALVNKENMGGSADGVTAMRTRVEQAKK